LTVTLQSVQVHVSSFDCHYVLCSWTTLHTLLWQLPCSFSRRAPVELHDNKDTKRSSWSSLPFFEISKFCKKCNDHDNLVYLAYPPVQKVREICSALHLRMYVHVCFSTFAEYLTALQICEFRVLWQIKTLQFQRAWRLPE